MTMKQARWLVATLLILGVLSYLWGRAPSKLSMDTPVSGSLTELDMPADCAVKGEGCRVEIEGLGAFRVHMPETVLPLEKFAFQVEPQGEAARSVGGMRVDFEMVGMDMGINAYRLERRADDSYRQEIILPVCTTSRSDWRANLSIHSTEGNYLLRLPFQVDRSRPAD